MPNIYFRETLMALKIEVKFAKSYCQFIIYIFYFKICCENVVKMKNTKSQNVFQQFTHDLSSKFVA